MSLTQCEDIFVYSPYDHELVGCVRRSADIPQVVADARRAFRRHRSFNAFSRHAILKRASAVLLAEKADVASLITRETGKPIKESHIEVDRASFVLEQAAEEAMRINGEIFPCDVTAAASDKHCFTFRRPLGVVAAITPFNFPLNIPVHKVASALAAGNAVVVKPSPMAPLTALKLRDILVESGLPEGLLSVVHGFREEAEVLAASDVNMVTFTGGTAAGANIARVCGMKKLSLELGDNGALIVFGDALIHAAVQTTIDQRFRTAGQRCTAVKRLFLHESIYEPFVRLLGERAGTLRRGNPLDMDVDIGPLISEEAAIVVERRLEDAVRRGGTVRFGGTREGNFIPPTVIENLPDDCELVVEETFGPVLPLFRFREVDEVVERVNASRFGLQAGIYTNNLDLVKRLSRELEVATLVVNDGPGFRIDTLPFGGTKESGLGREGGRCGIEEMTQLVNLIF
jgi:acyl-CoA reductase-like NAD-dependent aldehyde dehydrogenase